MNLSSCQTYGHLSHRRFLPSGCAELRHLLSFSEKHKPGLELLPSLVFAVFCVCSHSDPPDGEAHDDGSTLVFYDYYPGIVFFSCTLSKIFQGFFCDRSCMDHFVAHAGKNLIDKLIPFGPFLRIVAVVVQLKYCFDP